MSRLAFSALLIASVALVGCNRPTVCTSGPLREPNASLRGDVQYLAADAQQGRGIGTAGLDRAADFIGNRFRALGLRPAGTDGYFQPFGMTTNTTVAPTTSLTVDGRPLELNKDYTPLGFSAEGTFAGPVVFAGYGTTSTRPAYDDFAGADLQGKLVLFMRFGPHDAKGEPRLERTKDLASRAKAATDRGATGVLIVHPPRHHGRDELLPYTSPFGERRLSVPVVQVTQAVANRILADARQPDLAALQDRIDTAFKPATVDAADAQVRGAVALTRTRQAVKNVIALMPGVSDEIVVVGAHYDHLGFGVGGIGLPAGHPPTSTAPAAVTQPSTRPAGPQIYNGADDNASGVAAMLDVAFELAAAGTRPARSILFIAFTAEEEGVIGSRHFVDHPTVPLGKVVAMLNLDMVGRLKDDVLYVGGGGTARSFDAILKAADDASPLRFRNFGKGGLGPSDHMTFALKKVPVLFLFTGLHPDYHRPTDDADKVNYAGMEEVVRVALRLVQGMTTMPREQYVDSSDPTSMMVGARPGASLGVIPDYSVSDAGGLRIVGVTPDSAAAAAGLKGGDVIVRVGVHAVENIQDLSDVLTDAKPGDHVTVAVMRDGKRIELPAILTAPKRRND